MSPLLDSASAESAETCEGQNTGGGQSGGNGAPADPRLAAIVAAWDRLPEAVRAGIAAMVEAAAGEG